MKTNELPIKVLTCCTHCELEEEIPTFVQSDIVPVPSDVANHLLRMGYIDTNTAFPPELPDSKHSFFSLEQLFDAVKELPSCR